LKHRRAICTARKLHLVDALPHANDVDRVHADDEFGDGGVDQFGDRPRAAAVMGLAPSGQAFIG
jgi:hypothetical protein